MAKDDFSVGVPELPAAPADAPSGAAEDVLDALRKERDDYYERLLRTTAEFDNYRKRTDRERRELSQAAAADLIRDLLPVVDDLERALGASREQRAARTADELEGFRKGVELIHRQLLDVLRRRGVEPFDAVGQPFDPAWHEAVAHEPAGDRPDDQIVAELRRGYRLGDKLLRPAQVRVAKA